jgi:phosphoribosylformylglycinamidine cyclo-ligase
MGHRLEVYLPQAYAQTVIDCARSFGINAQIVGYVDGCQGQKLSIKSPFGVFEY